MTLLNEIKRDKNRVHAFSVILIFNDFFRIYLLDQIRIKYSDSDRFGSDSIHDNCSKDIHLTACIIYCLLSAKEMVDVHGSS